MNVKIAFAAVAMITFAAGCASRGEPAPGPDHPASPMAAEAPVPSPSTTLKVGDAPGETDSAASVKPAENTPSGAAAEAAADAPPVAYTCPHHPRVMQAEAGDCPLCGMALEPTTSAQTSPLRQRNDMPAAGEHEGHDAHEGHGDHAAEPQDAGAAHEHGGHGS